MPSLCNLIATVAALLRAAAELAGIADDVREIFDGVVALPGTLRHAVQAFRQRWGGDSEAPPSPEV